MTHVIITGGSSGIGLAVARVWLDRGARVSLLARRRRVLAEACESLKPLAGPDAARLFCHTADVMDMAGLETAIRACEAALGPCDVLVTSAGIVEPQAFDVMEAHVFDAQISTNFLGTVHAVRAVYPAMKRRGEGRIMLISSAAAFIGIHGYTAYCASKSALRGFAEALRGEASAHGVSVSIAYPPDTLTPQYEAEIGKRSPQAQALMGQLKPWPAARVATLIVSAIDKRRRELYFGPSLLALGFFGPFIKPALFWMAQRRLARSKTLR